MTVLYIKELYNDPNVQDDLRYDSVELSIIAKNPRMLISGMILTPVKEKFQSYGWLG